MAVAVTAFACFSPSAKGQRVGRPFGSVYGGLGYGAQWGYNWYGNDYDSPRKNGSRYRDSSAPTTRVYPAASAPYPTGQYYEPGDGYRYPLYYSPKTRTYIYYPALR